jgi:hypothetical protein
VLDRDFRLADQTRSQALAKHATGVEHQRAIEEESASIEILDHMASAYRPWRAQRRHLCQGPPLGEPTWKLQRFPARGRLLSLALRIT